jgi:crotonobetainyl-CoA:carnitine CoA-transferase CaiB-like acyl-CoA transferase
MGDVGGNAGSLHGRRVIELGMFIAAPFAGHLLSRLGAEVIKVEAPAGDPGRRVMQGKPGGSFLAYSAGKRSLCLDLMTDAGRQAFYRLLETADIVVHNLAPSSAEKLGVTREACLAANPALVYCAITGFGPGPRERELASNPLIEAATGTMFANRVDGRPVRLGPSYYDMIAGTYAVVGILAELLARGGGAATPSDVELGLYETGLHVNGRDIVAAQLKEVYGQATMSRNEFHLPGYASYETADARWVFLMVLSDAHWHRLCGALEIADTEELRTVAGRERRGREVDQLVADAVRGLTLDQVTERLTAQGAGYAEVRPYDTVLEDPQAADKADLIRYGDAYLEVPSLPIRAGSISSSPPGPPPGLGEHSLEILTSLGYSPQECHELTGLGATLGGE